MLMLMRLPGSAAMVRAPWPTTGPALAKQRVRKTKRNSLRTEKERVSILVSILVSPANVDLRWHGTMARRIHTGSIIAGRASKGQLPRLVRYEAKTYHTRPGCAGAPDRRSARAQAPVASQSGGRDPSLCCVAGIQSEP